MRFHRSFYSIFLFFCIGYSQVYNGYTIFSPVGTGPGSNVGGDTYLIDNQLNIINEWSYTRGAASMPYLLPDSTIFYPYRVQNPSMTAGGTGGGILKMDWEGNILWNYMVADQDYQHHHDIQPLPNGNVLVIAWERKTAAEAFAMGRQTIENSLNEMWSEAILELEPVETNDANIVWEWHLWDHMVQDVSSAYPNYGVIADHPELFDINFGNVGANQGPGGANADWKHFNAIDYNAELDQIAISARHHHEIYIIDHSTTTAEAAGHEGGNSGKGGDILYRWGNPQVYDRGNASDQQLSGQHGVNWIPEGYPGEGNLIIFNNNYELGDGVIIVNESAIHEIILPMDADGNYTIDTTTAFGPSSPTWTYTGNFHSNVQSGAFRLPTGNTLITVADDHRMFEVTNTGTIVWDYTHPGNNIMIARAQKYSMHYLGGTGPFPNYILGDINFDSAINIIDVYIVMDMLENLDPYMPPADMNGDGSLSSSDWIMIIQAIFSF